jgi:hypothetical protein
VLVIVAIVDIEDAEEANEYEEEIDSSHGCSTSRLKRAPES